MHANYLMKNTLNDFILILGWILNFWFYFSWKHLKDGITCLLWAGVGITSGTNLVLNLNQDNDIRNLQSKLNDLEGRLNGK